MGNMEQASVWQQKEKLVFWLKRMDIKTKLQWRNRYFFLLDFLFLSITPFLAMALRVSQPVWTVISLPIVIFAAISLIVKIAVFYVSGLYRHFWRYADGSELFLIVRAVIWATISIIVIVFGMKVVGVFPEGTLPRTLPFIDAILTVMAVGLPRFGMSSLGRPISTHRGLHAGAGHKQRVLIVGAGDAGQTIAREMLTSRYVNLVPVGFVDDDPQKQGMLIHRVQVLGTRQDIPDLVVEHGIEEVVIAMAVVPGQVIRDTVKICEACGIPCKTLPGLFELLNGEVEVKQIRDINIEDLLRRESLQIDDKEVAEIVEGACVLVTGAGGSIGSELCRQVIRYKPARLIMLGHGENSLFNISNELKRTRPSGVSLDVVVADVRDRARLETVFRRYRPNFVIHAAAHKHVPMMEDNIEDAVTTNVMGTQNVVSVAEAFNVERLVYISTDKAVDPVNVMGATKRFGESIVKQAGSRTGRPYLSVRFGNVLGSRGSVVPFFQRQIMRGGPVTVTHPDVTRYFMTIPEAVQLVLQAAALGTNGQVFVLNMGNPIKIVDLAHDLIELSGLKVNEDIEVVFTGLRPGEKLHERLFSDDEHPVPTKHNKILVAESSPAIEDQEYSMPPQLVEELIRLARAGEEQVLRERELNGQLLANSNQ
jgi:FlaA1/EpsC-like NDP-sugar epimerase